MVMLKNGLFRRQVILVGQIGQTDTLKLSLFNSFGTIVYYIREVSAWCNQDLTKVSKMTFFGDIFYWTWNDF